MPERMGGYIQKVHNLHVHSSAAAWPTWCSCMCAMLGPSPAVLPCSSAADPGSSLCELQQSCLTGSTQVSQAAYSVASSGDHLEPVVVGPDIVVICNAVSQGNGGAIRSPCSYQNALPHEVACLWVPLKA